MDYTTLSKFDDQKLIEGIKIFFQNSINLLNTGQYLAKNENFGIATSLTILSIEELIKAFAILQVYLGDTDPDSINPAFKGFEGAGNIHKARLKLASAFNFIFAKINFEKLEQKINIELSGINTDHLKEIKSEKELLEFINLTINNIAPALLTAPDALGLPENIENEIEPYVNQHSNWFSHAQDLKEKGFYADLRNKKWHLPKNVTIEEYKTAYANANETFERISNPIKCIIEGNEMQRLIIRLMIKKVRELK